MVKNTTLGKFYDVDSPVHRLNPVVKVLCIFFAVIMLFYSLSGFIMCAALVMLSLYLSAVPLVTITGTLRKFLWFYLFTGVFQLFLSPGRCLVSFGSTCLITHEGLYNACLITGRFMVLVLVSSILTWSTSSIDITGAIKDILYPAEKIGVPVRKIAVMTFLALRFIPILFDEIERIEKTQKMRGISMETKNILERFSSFISMVTPLLFCVFTKADNLAQAMESRCFFGDSDIKIPAFKVGLSDIFVLFLFLSCTLISFAIPYY